MKLKTITQLKNLKGQRVLLRVDFNIPLSKNNRISSGAEIKLRESLPTIEHLTKKGAKVIILTHLGRPKKRDAKLSLEPIARHLGKMMGQKILFVQDSLLKGLATERVLEKMTDGQVAVLENIRFYSQEEKNDTAFCKRLASLADIYVNDAFATSHRAHASIAGVTKYLDSYAGLLMDTEVKNLSRLLEKPKHPLVVMVGGIKISSKLPILKMMLKIADKVMVGGGIANAVFRAKGVEIGKSVVKAEDIKLAKQLIKDKKLILPVDVLAASSLTDGAKVRVVSPGEVRKNEYIVDIGVETVRMYAVMIKKAKTLVWNGPLGLFEVKKFSHGTISLGRIVAARSRGQAFGVVGGGETIAALELTGMSEWVDHVSTGGGAMLDFLSGKPLPGIKPLLIKK